MKKKIILVVFSIVAGILFTSFILNKENTYAKEEYMIFAFQAGAFEKCDNAEKFSKELPSKMIVKDDNLYKVYVALYSDIDIVNKMIVYFEDNDINIYLRSINVDKNFYEKILNYEQIIANTKEENVYKKINQSILDLYLESANNE